MKINKPIKILIGLATIWVAFFLILFWLIFFALQFYAIYVGMTGTDTDFQQTSIIFSGFFLIVFPLLFPTYFLKMGLLAFYLTHVIKNNQALEMLRVVLGVGSFFFTFIAMPIYYLLYIWPENPPSWALAPAQFGANPPEPTQGDSIVP